MSSIKEKSMRPLNLLNLYRSGDLFRKNFQWLIWNKKALQLFTNSWRVPLLAIILFFLIESETIYLYHERYRLQKLKPQGLQKKCSFFLFFLIYKK